MRRSLGGGGGGGRGMGGGNGGGMIRNVQRAVRAGVGGAPPEPFSSSTSTIAKKTQSLNKKHKTSAPNTALSLSSSSFSSLINCPIERNCSDDLEWECVDGVEDDERGKSVIYDDDDDFVFGNVPSRDEVHHAVSAIQQVLGAPSYTHFAKRKRAEDIGKDVADEGINNSIEFEMKSSSEESSQMDWIEPSMHLYDSRMLKTYGTNRVYDAFHLMQTEPSIQRMVFSLSSDQAIWDAVLNNEVVKELRGSIAQAQLGDDNIGESSSEGSNDPNNILSWIVVNAKAKIMQLIDTITKLVNGVLQPPNDEDKRADTINPLEEMVKTSLLISVVVLLIVVVTRAQSA